MCGILGIIKEGELISQKDFDFALSKISHRGPDDRGIWQDQNSGVTLGHCRLSIIDTTSANAQPMESPDGRWAVVYNGEIYNYQLLRNELRQRGHVFSTEGDTEVLLEAWRCWGPACLNRLEGMFAFALYDKLEHQLYAARDRVGEKPFFFTVSGGHFAFASELKALFALQADGPAIDYAAFNNLLARGYVSGSQCVIKGYNKLPPAHWLQYDLRSRSLAVTSYWSLPKYSALSDFSVTSLTDKLDQLLQAAVKRQLVADVPIGILLSGGLDSSLVTAYAAAMVGPLKTFTVTFPGYGSANEAPHALKIAKYFDTQHTEIEVDEPTPQLLLKVAAEIDEPLADPSLLPTYQLASAIRQHCKVALGGDGADELFGGYTRYSQWLQMQSKWGWLPLFLRNSFSKAANNLLPVGFRGRHYLQQLGTDFNKSIPWADSLFSIKERKGLLQNSFSAETSGETPESDMMDGIDLAERAMRNDFHHYLPDDILTKVDRASMMASLEVRAPFLDRTVVDFAFSAIPSHLKVTGNSRKILLRKVAARHLPSGFDFHRKQGFVPPLEIWFQKSAWREFFHDELLSGNQEIFNKSFVQQLWDGQQKGRFNKRRLFALLMISIWFKQYDVRY